MTDIEKYLINIGPNTDEILDTPIYRVFPLEKILTSLYENGLIFVKTRLWEDPFEAFLLKQVVRTKDDSRKYPFPKKVVESYYGQCWTFLKESNLLWKVYAPNNDGVIVETTIRKVFEIFIQRNTFRSLECYIGPVQYMRQEEIVRYFENPDIIEELFTDRWHDVILKSLFVKRQEFKEEAEVRIICNSNDICGPEINTTTIKFDYSTLELFNSLANKLILDPRIDPIRSGSISSLIKKLGFSGVIEKSHLFDAPVLNLKRH